MVSQSVCLKFGHNYYLHPNANDLNRTRLSIRTILTTVSESEYDILPLGIAFKLHT